MSDTGVIWERRGSCLILSMTNPGRRNALHPEMGAALCEGIEAGSEDPEVRAIILTGRDGHFCSGADLTRAAPDPDDREGVRIRMQAAQRLITLIASAPKPVIAAVEGDAFGGGLSIAAACDVIVAAEGARFGAAFVRIGLIPDLGLLHTLPRRIGEARARRLLLTGRPVLCAEAVEVGLADEPAPRGGGLARALEIAAEFDGSAPLSVAAIKTALSRGLASLEAATDFELEVIPALAASEDHAAARSAFLAKTPVRFKGR